MKTKLSTKGQVVLPGPLRQQLGLQPGDVLDASVETGCVKLTPRIKRPRKSSVLRDRLTNLPVLSAGPNAPVLTSKQVHVILAEFP